MKDFKELKVWQKAHEVTLKVYKLTAKFPDAEREGLAHQMRQAASAIGAGLAEGSARGSDKDFLRLAQAAMGSAAALENLLALSRDLGFTSAKAFEILAQELDDARRMLAGLIRTLNGEKRSEKRDDERGARPASRTRGGTGGNGQYRRPYPARDRDGARAER